MSKQRYIHRNSHYETSHQSAYRYFKKVLKAVMVPMPLFDLADGLIPVLLAADIGIISLMVWLITILLEASLLGRKMPGSRALRNSAAMNIATILIGIASAFIFKGPLEMLCCSKSSRLGLPWASCTGSFCSNT